MSGNLLYFLTLTIVWQIKPVESSNKTIFSMNREITEAHKEYHYPINTVHKADIIVSDGECVFVKIVIWILEIHTILWIMAMDFMT